MSKLPLYHPLFYFQLNKLESSPQEENGHRLASQDALSAPLIYNIGSKQ